MDCGIAPNELYVFYHPKDDKIVYSIALTDEDRDRFIDERGCNNMKMRKVSGKEANEMLITYKGNILEEICLGVNDDIKMLCTKIEYQTVQDMIIVDNTRNPDIMWRPGLHGIIKFMKPKYYKAVKKMLSKRNWGEDRFLIFFTQEFGYTITKPKKKGRADTK